MQDPERYGLEHYCVRGCLELVPDTDRGFPINVDGSTMPCRRGARFRIVDCARLLCRDIH